MKPDCNVRAHDVAQFLQVWRGKVEVVSVTPLHILVNAVQVQSYVVQQLRLQTHQYGQSIIIIMFNSSWAICKCLRSFGYLKAHLATDDEHILQLHLLHQKPVNFVFRKKVIFFTPSYFKSAFV